MRQWKRSHLPHLFICICRPCVSSSFFTLNRYLNPEHRTRNKGVPPQKKSLENKTNTYMAICVHSIVYKLPSLKSLECRARETMRQ